MKNLLLVIFLLVIGCNNDSITDIQQNSIKNSKSIDSLQQNVSVQFNSFQQIDSSDYLIFPLAIEIKPDTKNNVGSYFESYDYSRGNEVYFWNMLFYNTITGVSHLLHDSLKIIIIDYSLFKEASYKENTAADFIFYDVISTDLNKDNKLNEKDPTALFVSDKQGKSFRQISPQGYDVTTWRFLKKLNKIIMLTVTDSNGDQLLDEKDEIIPFQFDLTIDQPAKRVFDSAMTEQLKQQFLKTWQSLK